MNEKKIKAMRSVVELLKTRTADEVDGSEEIRAIQEEMIENFMQYASADLNKALFEFQKCITYSDFITWALNIKGIASEALIAYCKDKEAELKSDKRWEKVDKSEDIHAKKKKENGIVDFKKI